MSLTHRPNIHQQGRQGTSAGAGVSEEAPLVHSGGVRDTSAHNNSVKCSLSSRVHPVKKTKQTIWCCQRKEEGENQKWDEPKLCQSCASDTRECFISWYKNPTETSQPEVLQPGTRRTCPHSDLSSVLFCISIAVIGPVICFQTQRTGASLHRGEPTVFFRKRWEAILRM